MFTHQLARRAACRTLFFCLALCHCATTELPQQPPQAAAGASLQGAGQTFAVLGDFGMAGPGEQRVADLIHSWQPAFVVTSGDNNYPDGAADSIDANIGAYYHAFIRFGANYRGKYATQGAATQRFFSVLGNHDWHTPQVQPYLDYFAPPTNQRYYQTRQGHVELFMLDSDDHEPDGNTANSRQAHWLQDALKASQAPWKIVVMHHPPYSSGPHGPSNWMQWPYQAWGADVAIAGHDHHYERVQRQQFPYLVVGSGGATLRRAERPAPAADTDVHSAVIADSDFGALHVQATPQQLHFTYYLASGVLKDDFSLEKSVSSTQLKTTF